MNLRRIVRLAAPAGVVSYYDRLRLLRCLGSPLRLAVRAARTDEFRETSVHLLPFGSLEHLGCVIDVGANVGRWSTLLLRVASPSALLAVEPAPAVIPTLREALAPWPIATVLPVAAGPQTGNVDFHITAHSHNASVMTPRTEEMEAIYGGGWTVQDVIKVSQRPLDDLAHTFNEVSILKIDVQGYETAVLSGAASTLRKTAAVIIEVTFQSHYQEDTVFPMLHQLMVDNGFILRAVGTPSERGNELMWADAVYINSRHLEHRQMP